MKFFGGCVGILLVAVLFSAFSGWIFMLLFNWLVPLFWAGAPVLTFYQAWGLCFLINILVPKVTVNKNK